MQFVKKTFNYLTNVFVFKVALMILLIPTLLVQAVSFNYRVLFVVLAWGAALILYDIIKTRRFLTAPGMIWILLFLFSYGITLLLNFNTERNLNLCTYGYTFIALFLLYPDTTGSSKEKVLKEISIINNVFIAMTAVLSTISFPMFVFSYVRLVEFGDQTYVVGWFLNRLFGMYLSTGFMITGIGLALITIQLLVLRINQHKLSRKLKAFYIYSAVIDFICMCLENAKAAYLSLAAFIGVLVFFLAIRYCSEKGFKTFKKVAVSIISIALCVAVFFGVIFTLRPALSYVPGLVQTALDNTSEQTKPQKTNIERDVPESYGVLTGRTKIWSFGIDQYLKKPIFGYGANSHRKYYVVDGNLRHFHNLFIQCLVSVGTVGSLLIFIFFIKTMIKSFLLLFKRRKGDDKYWLVSAAIFALLVMFFVNSMAEVAILFMARFSMFIFWMYMGYMQTLLGDETECKDDRLFKRLVQKLLPNKKVN